MSNEEYAVITERDIEHFIEEFKDDPEVLIADRAILCVSHETDFSEYPISFMIIDRPTKQDTYLRLSTEETYVLFVQIANALGKAHGYDS